jgi:hypothetical protein
MRRFLGWIVSGALVSAFSIVAIPADAQQYWDMNRQSGRYRYGYLNNHYYGPYRSNEDPYQAYYYFYQPQPGAGYRAHTVYYDPRTDYYYYRNGQSGKFWGRCHLGTNNYEILAPENQRERLSELNDRSFQPLGRMPNVPDMVPPTAIIPPPSRVRTRNFPYTMQPAPNYTRSRPATPETQSAPAYDAPSAPPPPAPTADAPSADAPVADSLPALRPGRGRGGVPSAPEPAGAAAPGKVRGGEK